MSVPINTEIQLNSGIEVKINSANEVELMDWNSMQCTTIEGEDIFQLRDFLNQHFPQHSPPITKT